MASEEKSDDLMRRLTASQVWWMNSPLPLSISNYRLGRDRWMDGPVALTDKNMYDCKLHIYRLLTYAVLCTYSDLVNVNWIGNLR